jgi:hypothetical protein
MHTANLRTLLTEILFVLLLHAVHDPAEGKSHTAIGEILRSAEQYEGQTVVLEGDVVSVNYTPYIRDGMSLLSFDLADSTGQIKVLNQTAALLSRGDKVRVTGVLPIEV